MKNKFWIGIGSLSFVVFSSYYFNGQIRKTETYDLSIEKNMEHRDLASVGQKENSLNSKNLLNSLAQSSTDLETKIAKKPSDLDKFILEELQGKYFVEFAKGKVKSFHFDEQVSTQPLSLPKVQDFLKTHKNIWPIQFEAITEENDITKPMNKIFNLTDLNNKKVGKVQFTTDEKGLWKSFEFLE